MTNDDTDALYCLQTRSAEPGDVKIAVDGAGMSGVVSVDHIAGRLHIVLEYDDLKMVSRRSSSVEPVVDPADLVAVER